MDDVSDWARPEGDSVGDGPIRRALGPEAGVLVLDVATLCRMPGEWQARLVRLLDQMPETRRLLNKKT
jgi:hypothetical protein